MDRLLKSFEEFGLVAGGGPGVDNFHGLIEITTQPNQGVSLFLVQRKDRPLASTQVA